MTHLQKENLNHIPCQLPGVCLKLDWLNSDRKEEKIRKIRQNLTNSGKSDKFRQNQKNQTNSDQNSGKKRQIQAKNSDKFRPKFRQIQKNQTNSDQILV